MVVRHIKRHINTPFVRDSSSMLNGCSNKRPDVYFDLAKHCVIVEIDENQHKSYEDSCECARISQIVGGICGRSVILIRFNPDKIYNKKKEVKIPLTERLDTLIETIKEEIDKDYDEFRVILIQMYFDDVCTKYQDIKQEDITDLVCI